MKMAQWMTAAAMVGLLATSCGKKEPAGPSAPITIGSGEITMEVRDQGRAGELNKLQYGLKMTNTLDAQITINSIDYSAKLGQISIGKGDITDEMEIGAGETKTYHIAHRFEWRQDQELPAKATLEGTIHWTTKAGASRTSTFEVSGPYTQ